MNSELLAKANQSGLKLRKTLFKKFKNNEIKNIENLLQIELQHLLKALNDNDCNLFLKTIIPLYVKYQISMPSVFYETLKDDEHFYKILSAFILGLKGAYREPEGRSLEIDGHLCYDIKTITEKYGIKAYTIYNWIYYKKIKKASGKKTKKIYIRKEDIDKLIKAE